MDFSRKNKKKNNIDKTWKIKMFRGPMREFIYLTELNSLLQLIPVYEQVIKKFYLTSNNSLRSKDQIVFFILISSLHFSQ